MPVTPPMHSKVYVPDDRARRCLPRRRLHGRSRDLRPFSGKPGLWASAAVWLSFLIAGVRGDARGYAVRAEAGRSVPLLQRLGVVHLLEIQGFGKGHVTAITSWLLYFAALIVTAMVSVSFGNYAAALFFGESASPGWTKVLTTAVVLVVAAINIAGARFIDPSPVGHRGGAAGRVRHIYRCDTRSDQPAAVGAVDLPASRGSRRQVWR